MRKEPVQIIFGRRKLKNEPKAGIVEVRIYLGKKVYKYIPVCKLKKSEWRFYVGSIDYNFNIEKYTAILEEMKKNKEGMTIENFNSHCVEFPVELTNVEESRDFIKYILAHVKNEDISKATYRHKIHVIETLLVYGKILTYDDLTREKFLQFDLWLRETGRRTTSTVWDYHKRIRKYTRMLFCDGKISTDPYSLCKFRHGHSKQRVPLTEAELMILRNAKLKPSLERIRDLFVFAAYTGLSYVDVVSLDFKSVAQKHNEMYFIHDTRTKTDLYYHAPIFKPAMDVLEKYNYKLPVISNQKVNSGLHEIQKICMINKNITFHVARHSFATNALAKGCPIEIISKMLGHSDIRTTQIYSKIQTATVERLSIQLFNKFQ